MLYRLGRYGGLGPLPPCWRTTYRGYVPSFGVGERRRHCTVTSMGSSSPAIKGTSTRAMLGLLSGKTSSLPGRRPSRSVDAACRAAEVAAEMRLVVMDALTNACTIAAPQARACEGEEGLALLTAAEELSVAGLLALTAPIRRVLLHEWLGACARPRARAPRYSQWSPCSPGKAQVKGIWPGACVSAKCMTAYSSRVGLGPRRRRCRSSLAARRPRRGEMGGYTVTAEWVDRYEAPDVSVEAYVDAACLEGRLEVRAPRPGDRLRPLGGPGTRRLKDVFVDKKVPARQRASLPLVVCGGRIVWVCGVVVAEEGRITAETTGIVRLRLNAARDTGSVDGSSHDGEGCPG